METEQVEIQQNSEHPNDVRNKSIENLLHVSNPPTGAELEAYKDVSPSKLPPRYKRNILDRIFCNRDLRLDRIKWVGFDMDYTLAVYKSPEYEILAYNLIVNKLVEMGYPEAIKAFKYDPNFPIRGILIDKVLGHFIKVDSFGNILHCVHGRTPLTKKKTSELYPSLFISSEDIGKRFIPQSTLFNLPEICIYADLIDYFESQKSNLRLSQDIGFQLSFTNLFSDIRTAMDVVHLGGQLKQKTLENMEKYIKKTKAAVLLDRLRKAGIRVFLLTNSEFYYTDKVMSYLLEGQHTQYSSWREYFDVIIIGARKPQFFMDGTTLREVHVTTGTLGIGITERFEKGHIYEGGSIKLFEKFTGVKGNQVLYIGDHIYADIIKSKKIHAWRNLLVIPELEHELNVWRTNIKLYIHLQNLEFLKAEAFRGLDSECTQPPDITSLRQHMKQTADTLNKLHNSYFGSLFRSGAKQSQFSMQVSRYADLYTYDYLNLLNYPLFYHFSASYSTLPHEYVENLHVPSAPSSQTLPRFSFRPQMET